MDTTSQMCPLTLESLPESQILSAATQLLGVLMISDLQVARTSTMSLQRPFHARFQAASLSSTASVKVLDPESDCVNANSTANCPGCLGHRDNLWCLGSSTIVLGIVPPKQTETRESQTEHEVIFGFIACATPIAGGGTDLCAHIHDLDLLNLVHKFRVISNNTAPTEDSNRVRGCIPFDL